MRLTTVVATFLGFAKLISLLLVVAAFPLPPLLLGTVNMNLLLIIHDILTTAHVLLLLLQPQKFTRISYIEALIYKTSTYYSYSHCSCRNERVYTIYTLCQNVYLYLIMGIVSIVLSPVNYKIILFGFSKQQKLHYVFTFYQQRSNCFSLVQTLYANSSNLLH